MTNDNLAPAEPLPTNSTMISTRSETSVSYLERKAVKELSAATQHCHGNHTPNAPNSTARTRAQKPRILTLLPLFPLPTLWASGNPAFRGKLLRVRSTEA